MSRRHCAIVPRKTASPCRTPLGAPFVSTSREATTASGWRRRQPGSWWRTGRARAARSVTEAVTYLDTDDLLTLATALLGDPPPVRDLGLLGSAAGRPRASAFGEDAYPDLWTKAAAMLQSIVKNHALVDGNKRLGWLATAVFLEINGVAVAHVHNEAVYVFVTRIASGSDNVADIARELRSLVERRTQ